MRDLQEMSASSAVAPAANSSQPIETSAKTVACNGGGGALGHPVTYYTFGDKTQIDCRYCGQVFVKK